MPPLLDKVLQAAQRASSRVHGGQIIYERGAETVWITATFGRSEFQVEAADTVRIEHTDRDFIFPAEALILGGRLAAPQQGDRITVVEQEHGDGQLFEVLPADGKQCFRQCDPTGHLIRVYTKRVGHA